MPIDPSIALGYKGIEVPNRLAQYGQMAQIENAQRQGQISQMQIEELKNDRVEMQKLQEDIARNGGNPNLHDLAATMLKSPKHFTQGAELMQKLDAQQRFADIMKMGAPQTAPAIPTNAPNTALTPVAPVAPVANQLAPVGPDVNSLRAKRDAFLALGTPQGIAAARALDADIALASREPVYHNVTGVGLVDPRTSRVIMPSVESTDPLIKQYEYAKNQGFKGSLFDYKQRLAEASRTPAQPSAPVAVVDETTGTIKYVNRGEAIGKTPATAFEGIAPKEIQKREAAFPQATSSIKGFEAKSDSFVKDLEKLRDHPGLSQITGIAAGRLPGITDDGRAAQALYDKIVAKGGFQALQDLRDASKTGGALGNVSNQEGKQLTASFAAIDRRQDAEDVKAAIDQAIGDVQGAKTRMREAYDSTYQYKQPAPAAGKSNAAPAGGNSVSLPNGTVANFPTPEAAAAFKKATGLQ